LYLVRNMRSLLLAALAVIAIPACTDDITGGKGGGSGDQGGGAVCGNGIIEAGEQCDDGNTVNGDGCSSTCQNEDTSTPRAVLNVDMPTVGGTASPVDLNVETDVTITATSMMGFTGDLALTATVADSSGTPITDWTAAIDNPTLTLTSGGMATAHIGISAQGDALELAGTVTVTATLGSMTSTVQIATTFQPEVRVEFKDDPNQATGCLYPTGHEQANPYLVKVGRTFAVYNMSTGTVPFIVHSDLSGNNFNHETQALPGTAPAANYAGQGPLKLNTGEQSATTVFYCHQGIAGTMLESAADPPGRQYLQIVP
jgi:cysteine-rich repeat protein